MRQIKTFMQGSLPEEDVEIAESVLHKKVPTGAEDLAADYARAVEHVCKTKKATLSSFQFDLGFGFMCTLAILDLMNRRGWLVRVTTTNRARSTGIDSQKEREGV